MARYGTITDFAPLAAISISLLGLVKIRSDVH